MDNAEMSMTAHDPIADLEACAHALAEGHDPAPRSRSAMPCRRTATSAVATASMMSAISLGLSPLRSACAASRRGCD
jgi:hypothetical protein